MEGVASMGFEREEDDEEVGAEEETARWASKSERWFMNVF
jgi:hypothetical protein